MAADQLPDAGSLLATLEAMESTGSNPGLLSGATARLSHDFYDLGVDHYKLVLELPLTTFSAVETEIPTIEARLTARAQAITRGVSSEYIGGVVLVPQLQVNALETLPESPAVTAAAQQRLWDDGMLRLFYRTSVPTDAPLVTSRLN